MRLFVAINPKPVEKQAAYDWVQRLEQAADGGKFTRRDNLHLTLAFLGETEREQDIRGAMAECLCAPFSLTLDGFGWFRSRSGMIYWMGVEPNPALEDLQQRLSGALRRRGFVQEERPFRPHLTLGRGVRLDQSAQALLKEELRPLSIGVDRISLMCSRRIGGALCYTEEATTMLKGGTEL